MCSQASNNFRTFIALLYSSIWGGVDLSIDFFKFLSDIILACFFAKNVFVTLSDLFLFSFTMCISNSFEINAL